MLPPSPTLFVHLGIIDALSIGSSELTVQLMDFIQLGFDLMTKANVLKPIVFDLIFDLLNKVSVLLGLHIPPPF